MHRLIDYKIFEGIKDASSYEPKRLGVWPHSEIAEIVVTGDKDATFEMGVMGYFKPNSTEGVLLGQINDTDYTKSTAINKKGGYKVDVSGFSAIGIELTSVSSDSGINCEIALLGG